VHKYAIFWVIAAVMLVAGNPVLADDETPSGKIVIDETQVMILLGGSMGGGTLLLGDDSYSFKTGGLKLGGVGVQKVHITGDVYHLEKAKDFPGNYVELEASAAVIKGKGGLWLKNKKGVTLNLKSNNEGLMLSLSAGSLQISMN
jgi:hypothetical protein